MPIHQHHLRKELTPTRVVELLEIFVTEAKHVPSVGRSFERPALGLTRPHDFPAAVYETISDWLGGDKDVRGTYARIRLGREYCG
jgi:hypothetical protein